VTSRRGSVSILMVAVVATAAMVMLGVARAGAAAAYAAQADTAADAAALAAAEALARHEGISAAMDAARVSAAENGAVLIRCTCTFDTAEVTVVVHRATGRARAEVRRDCLLGGCHGAEARRE
jgi:hypothetical protein